MEVIGIDGSNMEVESSNMEVEGSNMEVERSNTEVKTETVDNMEHERIFLECERFRWMDERCFRPLLCTVKAELGRGQPGLMRWIWDETLPQSSIDRSTFYFCSSPRNVSEWYKYGADMKKSSV